MRNEIPNNTDLQRMQILVSLIADERRCRKCLKSNYLGRLFNSLRRRGKKIHK